ncbi:MAG: L-seryl-tRNA(Sec) selenium transferase [Blastocatellia bacterium]|nr:L-seryl-tRNA(Sec) selenium transferase [Blastocatellia bacterium]MCS7157592.1 L-seryl-tRNA(Sec) selenium transferase [Blastocatellia bacterium]MCX7751857.1 L-seryl-tRNA(Sec) selenium transferase [Blastocatellia bacterium]MDW8166963.1 L-seryl-tRNA(Sec) selenium transferase [Acidobacteriota bacterium]MDW8257067.1 L-seryl-tRNA(Sec) selenium transferase [Acidobacteriota bacterium]
MTEAESVERLRAIPSVESILHWGSIAPWTERFGRAIVVREVRAVTDELRRELRAGHLALTPQDVPREIERRLRARLEAFERPSLRRVINATGVVLHTNLGRAPLSAAALQAIERVGVGYSNLEFDLVRGERGRREMHCQDVLRHLLDVEAALVVNNNAAAVLLVLNTLAEGGEVIVSRGELIEIGGAFRLPEIMAKSGAILREVGTTNRTRLEDYERAITERTRLILRAHWSNFRIIGFTERPSLRDLVALAHRHGLPCYEDLGSGCLVDLRPWGIPDEPTVAHSLAEGVDVCSFSGDKLLGGPQAGIIVGRAAILERLARNPLMRVVRPDKLTLAALEATLRAYLAGRLEEIPVLRMIALTPEQVRRRARAFASRLRRICGEAFRVRLRDGVSVAGGGAAPEVGLRTALIALRHERLPAHELEARLRAADPPIIARIEEEEVLLDLRTVSSEEEELILRALSLVATSMSL